MTFVGTVEPRCSRSRRRLLVASAITVVLVAGVFDVAAGETPSHTLGLMVVAGSVGLARWALRGRLRGLFFLINLAIVVQPVAHGISHLARAGTESVSHSHHAPAGLSGVALQITIALVAVVVAGSEPLGVFVVASVRSAVGWTRSPRIEGGGTSWSPARLRARARSLLANSPAELRCRPRRGPPRPVGSPA